MVFLSIMAAVILASCGNPHNMSKQTYDRGIRALEIMEKYNLAEISEDDACSRILTIWQDILNDPTTNEKEIEANEQMAKHMAHFYYAVTENFGSPEVAESDLKEYLEIDK